MIFENNSKKSRYTKKESRSALSGHHGFDRYNENS